MLKINFAMLLYNERCLIGPDLREGQFWYHLKYKQKEEYAFLWSCTSVKALVLLLFPI